MTEHIENILLEKLFVCPDEIGKQEKDTIASHLEKCVLCREHATKLKEFYEDLLTDLASSPTARDKAFAGKMLARKKLALSARKQELPQRIENALDTFVEIIEPYQRPLLQRFVRYIQIHPIRFAGATSLAGFAMVLAFLLVKPMFKDTNPAYARAKDEFLVVYNKNGDELWRKHIGMGFDLETIKKDPFFRGIDNLFSIADVDNDNRNEVIVSMGVSPKEEDHNKIICFQSDGTQRWQYEFHGNATFGKESFSDNYSVNKILVDDFENNGKVQIIGVANHQSYYPTVIFKLDADRGEMVSEYWHSGSIYLLSYTDIDKDGRKEIVCGGENNGFNLASVIVFDPRNMSGKSPAPSPYSKLGTPLGEEKYYILYPRNDLGAFAYQKRNKILNIFMREKVLEIRVADEIGAIYQFYPLYYLHDSTMTCTKVTDTDPFVQLHHKLEKEGKLTKKLNDEYYEELRRQVQYWDGEKLVNHSTMNKRYLYQLVAK